MSAHEGGDAPDGHGREVGSPGARKEQVVDRSREGLGIGGRRRLVIKVTAVMALCRARGECACLERSLVSLVFTHRVTRYPIMSHVVLMLLLSSCRCRYFFLTMYLPYYLCLVSRLARYLRCRGSFLSKSTEFEFRLGLP